MKRYLTISEYCKESGFPIRAMRQLLHCYLAPEFCFRTTSGKTAPFYINVVKFESMLESGEFREVLEQ